jgi:DnaK suppressor protein
MARRDALLRLHQTLVARSEDLRRKLAGELADLRDFKAADSACDSVDVAFETSSDEMSSQLAELDSRELGQIDRALARLTQGTYGVCEGGSENCQKRIPVARLNAVPYTTFCIHCVREMEKHSDRLDREVAGHWDQVFDSQALMVDQRINLAELAKNLSSKR